jgi:hypothetical protein
MTTAPEPEDPQADGSYGPFADPLPAALADSFASWAAAQTDPEPEPDLEAEPW